jgi:catechol 2,3-dioxygenase-like lactoylglutathione lyase family enzyme
MNALPVAHAAAQFVPVRGLHHFAWRCRDAEETRRFYEDILGLPLAHLIRSDIVPSTGEHCPYVHIFFRLDDGSFIAFFDLGDDLASDPSPNTPMWVNHLALRVDSVERLQQARERLQAAGVEVVGITDHKFIQSIYFFDPNGIRLELTVQVATPQYMEEAERKARAALDAWTAQKEARRAAGDLPPTGQVIVRSHGDPNYR